MSESTNIAVLPLEADLDVRSVPEVQAQIDDLINEGCRRIILNLSDASYIDSFGMGMLFSEIRHMRSVGGLLSLIGVSPEVYRSLEILRLVDAMPVCMAGMKNDIPALDIDQKPLWRTSFAVQAESLAAARNRIAQLASSRNLTNDELFDIKLAAGEALGNAIDHTCAQGVLASVAAYADRLIVEVSDCGEGFSPQDVAAPSHDAERGRGIALMRLLADAVYINPKPNGPGTVVRIVKLTH